MATEARRLARLLAICPALVALALPAKAAAAQAWWEPLAFAGQRVTSVSAAAGTLVAGTSAGAFVSSDAGRSFQPLSAQRHIAPVPPAATVWAIDDGTVVTGSAGQPVTTDPRAPNLGAAAHLIAAPAALPGVVVAVGSDNHVWRRDRTGHWATSFVLLPAGGLAGAPPVTALAAFATPLTGAVYMATAGYGVLLSDDGGDDWIRADPGLPANVLALAADPAARALYAATDQGLFVHHLQAFPRPAAYHDSALYLRWLGIALVSVLACVAAVAALRAAMPRTQGDGVSRR